MRPFQYQTNFRQENDNFLVYSFILCGLLFLFKLFRTILNSLKNESLTNTENTPQFITNSNADNLNTRMTYYEIRTETQLLEVGDGKPFIIRLKGRNFKNIKNNDNYTLSLQSVGMELMKEFHAQTAMVFNDEILLIFSPSKHQQFNGRCSKLYSVIASQASSLLSVKTQQICSFHCNIVDFDDSTEELLNYIKWRTFHALSLKTVPFYIKRMVTVAEPENVYKHVKFTLVNTSDCDEYLKLFASPNFNTNDYTIKFKKIYEMNEIPVMVEKKKKQPSTIGSTPSPPPISKSVKTD